MPKPGGRWYSYAEQAAHYRQAARDRGCTCPDLMAPHTHLLECVLYEVPGGTPRTFHRHAPAAGPSDGAATTPGESPPHDLPLADSPGAGAYLEHLDQEHDADDGRPWL